MPAAARRHQPKLLSKADAANQGEGLLSLMEMHRRDAILEAIAMSARELLRPDDRRNAVQKVLELVGTATGVDRAQLFGVAGGLDATQFRIVDHQAWTAPGLAVPALAVDPATTFDRAGLGSWAQAFAGGEPVVGRARDFAPSVQAFLHAGSIQSILAVPVFVEGSWWGALSFDSCRSEREWLQAEIDTLKILAELMGAAVASAQHHKALADANRIIESSPTVLYRLSATPPFPLTYLSQNFRQYGYEADALLATPERWAKLIEPADLAGARYNLKAMAEGRRETHQQDFRFKRPDGSLVWFAGGSRAVRDSAGQLLAIEGLLTDITERRRASERYQELARTDALTGLPNRMAFLDRLALVLARARRTHGRFAVLYLDIDRFKDVNDTLGHPAGDALLRAVADRLTGRVRQTDMAARFGGDEFAILLEDAKDIASIEAAADDLGKAVSVPFTVDRNELHVTVSIGVVPCDSESESAEAILTQADLALYRAKSDGRDGYRLYVPALDHEAQEQILLGNDLHGAVERNEFELFYQPQVELGTRRIVGLEALIRWNHPTKGRLSPDLFIPVAESNGAIRQIGRWVIERGCTQIAQWRSQGIAPPLVAVNVSAAQFQIGVRLDEIVSDTMARHRIKPSELELELTESVLMTATQEHRDVFDRLRRTGVRIAVDDFGTGFSSLAYLTSFRVSRLKLASRFIERAVDSPGDAAIVRATLQLAAELDIDVVAEGISTAAQESFLIAAGCKCAQGYYFGLPMPAEAITALLAAQPAEQ